MERILKGIDCDSRTRTGTGVESHRDRKSAEAAFASALHASKSGDWAKKLSGDLGSRPGFALYQLPVLEDVPRIIRGMVISGTKKGVPENQRDHFVPILQDENELKKAVHYKEPDEAYLVLLDPSGNTVQMTHGALSEASYGPVREKVDSLLSQPK